MDMIRYMDKRLLFDYIYQTNVLCKETYLALNSGRPLKLLSYVPFINSIETSLQLQRLKVTKVRYMS